VQNAAHYSLLDHPQFGTGAAEFMAVDAMRTRDPMFPVMARNGGAENGCARLVVKMRLVVAAVDRKAIIIITGATVTNLDQARDLRIVGFLGG